MPEFQTEEDFRAKVEPHRRDVVAHCYRMVGSISDADDLAQETLLRAWNHRQSFEGRASLRTWLHRIATNACLDFLESRPARGLPADSGPAWNPNDPLSPPSPEPVWLTPAPSGLFSAAPVGPDARYSVRESVALAFLAALQLLPPKQRAVLLFRDVLGWEASEVAEALELSVAAVNSALQRARATLDARRASATEETKMEATDQRTTSLLQRYMKAWETSDLTGLVALLREDATFSMPPMPCWYSGREAIGAFIQRALLSSGPSDRYRARLITANGAPALAMYEKDAATGVYRAICIQVVEVRENQVASVISFLDPKLFPRFELPLELAAGG